MSKTLHLELVTPKKKVLEESVGSLILPGIEGSFGVLPGHVTMVAALKPGMLKVVYEESDTIYAVGGGYAEIANDRVIVLADSAELGEDIDVEAAKRQRAKAAAQIKAGIHGPDLDKVEISLKKALARLSVANAARAKKLKRSG